MFDPCVYTAFHIIHIYEDEWCDIYLVIDNEISDGFSKANIKLHQRDCVPGECVGSVL